MQVAGFAAVAAGASLGAWLRWWLAGRLNPLYPILPLGTLAANLLGGLLVGLAVAWFERNPALPAELRLLVITGFLGGLTTFSTFSAEVVTMMGRGQWLAAAGTAAAHLAGSLLLTGLGFALVAALVRGN